MSDLTTPTRIDDFTGPGLDSANWHYLEYPMGDDPAWVCKDPATRFTVRDGRCTVDIDRFELAHPVQIIDNCKFVTLSTRSWQVPETGTLTVSADMAATSINASGDYRDGFASLVVIDPSSGLVYDIASTGEQVFAIHELLPVGEATPFTRVVDSPLESIRREAGVDHHCEITLDRAHRSVRWVLDDTVAFDARDVDVPASINVGMGIFTLHPVGDASESLRGQGLQATWSNLSISSREDGAHR